MHSRIFELNIKIFVLFFILFLPVLAHSAITLPFRSDLNRGNDFYKKGEYAQAGQFYNKILEKKSGDMKAKFNFGDSLYKQGKYQGSQNVFESLTGNSVPKDLRQAAYYNLGNSFFKQEDYKSAIGAYEEALKIDPKDKDAHFNLELAKKMLTMPKQEKEKQQKKEDEKNKKQQNENKPDNKDKNKDKQKEKEQNQQNQTKPGQMSKEDALRILNAFEDQEKHKTQKIKAGRGKADVEDW
ncbi:MAG: tetratricopeptide repeat protein [Syntrophaceae bacterium]|nr:tetratricopeptide repeat protein [Syntrophaceae bacterium]